MASLPLRRLVVDASSKHAVAVSPDTWGSNFNYTLPWSLAQPRHTKAFVNQVSFSVGNQSNIDANSNHVFIVERRPHGPIGGLQL